jgi:hypothetical protein
MGELGMSYADVVQNLHYTNINKGIRNLQMSMRTGRTHPFVARNLATALAVDQTVIDRIVAETNVELHIEELKRRTLEEVGYRARFVPHLKVETERSVPQPIFVAAMAAMRRLRTVPVPSEVWIANEEMRDEIIRASIMGHFSRSRGHVPAFGMITGYSLVLNAAEGFDMGLPFDIEGRRIGPMKPVERLGRATWLGKVKKSPFSRM